MVGPTPPASAQVTNLRGTVGTYFLPTIQQSFTNVPTAVLGGLTLVDVNLNEAAVTGSLFAPLGRFALSAHACSGGGPGYTGTAQASANVDVTLDYVLASSTLPAGTPVQVLLSWAVSSKVVAIGQDMVGVNSYAQAGVGLGRAFVYINGTNVDGRSGSYSMSHRAYDGISMGPSGTLDVLADSFDPFPPTFVVLVGQTIRFWMVSEISANSSIESGTADGDAQLVMLWGATPLTSDAYIHLAGDPNQLAPPAETATASAADSLRPPRPVYLLPCFRISTQPEGASICDSDSATFTVTPLGTGPFTYRWRKNGVRIDSDLNPSATEATLLLMNATPDDAGSYDVVISNPCGDIISDAAPLAVEVCVVSVEADQVPPAARLAAARPAPFRASTTLAFDLASAGEAKLEVFNLRGARVRTLASGWHEAGRSEVVWHGEDEVGRRVPAGVYLVRLQAGGLIGTQRIVKMP